MTHVELIAHIKTLEAQIGWATMMDLVYMVKNDGYTVDECMDYVLHCLGGPQPKMKIMAAPVKKAITNNNDVW